MATKKLELANSPLLAIMQAANGALLSIRRNHPELTNVVLVVGASGQKKGGAFHGRFSPNSWEAQSAPHEIILSGESLERGARATIGTLLHECAHLLANVRGIQDTSRQGRFHNKKFAALATELGIDVEQDPSIGWSLTSVPDASATLYSKEIAALDEALKAYRKPLALAAKKPKTTIRLNCDCRGLTVPISFITEGGIKCELCEESFS